MATLTSNQKIRARAAIDRAYCSLGLPMPWTKPELDAEITNIDSWQDLNQALIAQQYSAGFRAIASAADLALIFILITIARRLVSQPNHIAVLRHILDQIQGIDGV